MPLNPTINTQTATVKKIYIPAMICLHVAGNTSDDQINTLVYNLTNDDTPAFDDIQTKLETLMMDTASAEDIEVINNIDIDDATIWITGDDVEIYEYDGG